MLSQLLGETSKIKEIETSILKVRGQTLIFDNSIFQISNISTIEVVDLSTVKPVPQYFLWMFLASAGLLFSPVNYRVIGILMLIVLSWLFYRYQRHKTVKKYGLGICMNSGALTVFYINDLDFLKQVVFVLHNIINTDELKAINFNIDEQKIELDNSVKINQMLGSSIVSGSVVGDVVNQV